MTLAGDQGWHWRHGHGWQQGALDGGGAGAGGWIMSPEGFVASGHGRSQRHRGAAMQRRWCHGTRPGSWTQGGRGLVVDAWSRKKGGCQNGVDGPRRQRRGGQADAGGRQRELEGGGRGREAERRRRGGGGQASTASADARCRRRRRRIAAGRLGLGLGLQMQMQRRRRLSRMEQKVVLVPHMLEARLASPRALPYRPPLRNWNWNWNAQFSSPCYRARPHGPPPQDATPTSPAAPQTRQGAADAAPATGTAAGSAASTAGPSAAAAVLRVAVAAAAAVAVVVAVE